MKSRRTLNLPPQLANLLSEHKIAKTRDRLKADETWHDGGLVFTTGNGRPIDPRNLYRPWVKCVEASGLGRLTLHELRHTAASLMMESGVPIESVSSVLGHSTIRLTADVYGHIGQRQRQNATEAMAAVMWS